MLDCKIFYSLYHRLLIKFDCTNNSNHNFNNRIYCGFIALGLICFNFISKLMIYSTQYYHMIAEEILAIDINYDLT